MKEWSNALAFQSPQWGSNSKSLNGVGALSELKQFQSPQWGSNSKEV